MTDDAGGPGGIVAFLKVFEIQEYAEAFFRQGLMHMKTVDWFRRMEEDGTGRADRRDSVDRILQPDRVILSWKLPDGTEVALPKPLSIEERDDETSGSHLFCLYSLTNHHLEQARAGLSVLDEKLADLGQFAVLINRPDLFIERFDARTHRGGVASQRMPVEYLDLATHHGEVGPFRKDTRFSYQYEYRMLTEPSGEDFQNLEIGSLTDLACCLPFEEGLDDVLAMSLREATRSSARG